MTIVGPNLVILFLDTDRSPLVTTHIGRSSKLTKIVFDIMVRISTVSSISKRVMMLSTGESFFGFLLFVFLFVPLQD